MYYFAKILQATGLGIILIAFLKKFPALLDPKILLVGILFFGVGWIINGFLIKR